MDALKSGTGTPLGTMLTPSTPKRHMMFFCEQIELRVAPTLLQSASSWGVTFWLFRLLDHQKMGFPHLKGKLSLEKTSK